MQGIYTHIPDINYVPKEYSVAAILLFLFMVLISLVSVLNLLYFYISTSRSLLLLLLLLLLSSSLSSSSSSSSPLCRVFILIFLRQTISLGNSVAAILLLLFMVLISLVAVLNLLYFYISTFRSMCAVPNMAVFCSSLT